MSKEPRVLCRTPTLGKQGTRIAKWKYDLVRARILEAVPRDEIGVEFSSLPSTLQEALSEAEREKLGSVSWYTTAVKLDVEVRGEIERVPGSRPQRLRRTQ
ncbi:DUF6958 family protein [Chloroflexota bacterium]